LLPGQLLENPEFINAKQQLKQRFSKVNIDPQILQEDVIVNQKVNKKTVIAYFLTYCGSPACFILYTYIVGKF